MPIAKRRLQLIAGALLVVAAMTAAYVAAQPAQDNEPVIKITAKKFEYTPHDVQLKKGVPVILELTTQDVFMGFNAPDLGVRADMVPGKTVRVRVVPAKLGKVEFLCDVFCGSGHEEMSGLITVVD
ncbi:MAG: cytochrome-c oxidase [Betaproteobacteria bacterium]|nr:cytochrome-c oxidase [Betaproteobacteria bacterium]